MSRKGYRDRSKFLAKLVTENRKPCAFCQREVDDEITYGKLYSIGDIQCHYFCVLLSCCLVQKGKDNEGLFGFLYPDILAELERSKKHKCSFCNKEGATLGCCVSQCRKQFHLPCGRERQAVSLFYGNYKSFCKNHAPKQKVTDNVMAKAKLRMQANRKSTKPVVVKQEADDDDSLKAETVCVICYEDVECYPTPQTFWPPCCARDAWFHRSCVQRMSLSAGMHYLKCPLCNDKENFYQAVISQGFYVPDRDAAWELEQNAFAEIYERELSCSRATCLCPRGREHDAESGPWDIKLCLLCGSAGAHARCLADARFVCDACAPAAPRDLDRLAADIDTVIVSEQARAASRRGPVMPGRMSLRRTKQRQALTKTASLTAQTSASHNESNSEASSNTTASRQELNLTTPRRGLQAKRETKPESVLKDVENKLFSPVKMIEQGLKERVRSIGNGMENLKLESSVVEKVRAKFRKPKPLSEKKKIVDGILNDLVNNMLKESSKVKEPVRAWCSPKKESIQEMKLEIQEQVPEIADLKIKENTTDSRSPTKTSIYVKKRNSNSNTDNNERTVEVDELADASHTNTIHTDTIKDPKMEHDNTESMIIEPNTKEDGVIEASNTEASPIEHSDIKIETEDDSSNSTFQLAPEFVADDSNDSLPTFDTPKKLKTVEIKQDSSMEISENNDIVNVDLITIDSDDKSDFSKNFNVLQSPTKKPESEKCAFKFSPTNKEALVCNKMDIDLESFKNHYLNEVHRDFKCNFNHKHQDNDESPFQLRTAIDFAIDAAYKNRNRKRKLKSGKKKAKRSRNSGIVLKYDVDNRKKVKKNKTTKVSIQNDNMKVKISLKREKFKLRIMQSKFEDPPKTLKQYVLKYSDGTSNEVMGKPEKDVTPIKRKYVKLEKSPDNLKQLSIQSFFKSKD